MKKIVATVFLFSFLISVSAQTAGDLIEMGNSKYSNKDYEGALADYDKAVELDANNIFAYYNRGNVKNRLKNYDGAIADYSKAIEINPEYFKAYLSRGNARYNQQKMDEAKTDYNVVIAKDSANKTAYYQRGNINYSQKNFTEAKADYSKTIELDPLYPNAYFSRAVLNAEQNDNAGALADYGKVIELDPNYSNARFNRAILLLQVSKYEEALVDFDKLIALEPQKVNGYYNRANTKLLLKDIDGAKADYTKTIEIDPRFLNGWIGRAAIKRSQKDLLGATADYNKVIEIDSRNINGYMGRVSVKLDQKDYADATADCDKVLEIDPGYEKAFVTRSVIRRILKDYEGALADCDNAIALDPNNYSPYYNKAALYYKMGKYAESVEANKKAISLNPNYGYSYYNIIESLARLHQFTEAAEYYNTYTNLGIKTDIDTEPNYAYYRKYIEAVTNGAANKDYERALKNLQEAESLFRFLDGKDESGFNGSLSAISELTGYILEKRTSLPMPLMYDQLLAINASQPDVKLRIVEVEKKITEQIKVDKTPPTIEILHPIPSKAIDIESDNGKTQIIGRAKDISGISAIKINGVPVADAEKDGLFITELPLKEGNNELLVTATDMQGNEASEKFTLTGAAAPNRSISEPEISLVAEASPKYYAILIAENEYVDEAIPDLKNPVKDATELKSILENQYSFSATDIDTLYNMGREDIMESIIQRCNSLTENDNLLIFYAGHGIAEKDRFDNVDGYWIPVSAKKGQTASYISQDDINRALKRSTARHILLIADACFSGAFTRSLDSDANKYIQQQYKMPSRKIMASGNLEPVPDNSLLMHYLKKSLKENTQKYVSAKELFDGFYKAIINNTDNLPQYAAIKNVGDEGGEFVFIKK
ncbi:MAG: tetratricopeptide repeat protein [Chitinophagaceae bacterium]|nr:tetratricopeptide repeat protein [Chitinophagaceae bacterium]